MPTRGFSLIEILVTVAIIAIIAAIAIPIFNNQKTKAAKTVAIEDGHALQTEIAALLTNPNPAITTGSTDTTSITTTGTPPTTLTINYGTGATPATSPTLPIKLSANSTLTGSLPSNTTNPTTYCLKITNNNQTAIYTEAGYQPSSNNCYNGQSTTSLIPSTTFVWAPNQTVTISDENGWKKGVTDQSTSSPGIRIAENVPVTPNTSYTFSVDAYKNSLGSAYLFVGDMSWAGIAWTGAPLTTTPTRLSTTFNSGSNTSIRLAILWAPPGGTGSTLYARNPTLTQN